MWRAGARRTASMAAYCCLCLDDLNGEDCEDVACEAAPCGHVFHKCARHLTASYVQSCAVPRAPSVAGPYAMVKASGRGRCLTRETDINRVRSQGMHSPRAQYQEGVPVLPGATKTLPMVNCWWRLGS